eukprot:scaffold103469_cov33-Prasinocladus_malaysianus.AAC.1
MIWQTAANTSIEQVRTDLKNLVSIVGWQSFDDPIQNAACGEGEEDVDDLQPIAVKTVAEAAVSSDTEAPHQPGHPGSPGGAAGRSPEDDSKEDEASTPAEKATPRGGDYSVGSAEGQQNSLDLDEGKGNDASAEDKGGLAEQAQDKPVPDSNDDKSEGGGDQYKPEAEFDGGEDREASRRSTRRSRRDSGAITQAVSRETLNLTPRIHNFWHVYERLRYKMWNSRKYTIYAWHELHIDLTCNVAA